MTKATRFCVIRHGETAWNAERRYQGQIDIDLNQRGEQQAMALRPVLARQTFTAFVASDLTRAWRTAQLALGHSAGAISPPGQGILPALTLRERHYGVFQGLTVAEAKTVHPHAHAQYLARALDYDFETGESLPSFARRVMDGFAALAEQHSGGTVAVFTHGGVLDVLRRVALGRDLQEPRDFPIPNAAINWLRIADGCWHLESWAERHHLTHLDHALDEVAQ